jgi:hypothetical protein
MRRKKDHAPLICSPLLKKALELLLKMQNHQTQPHPIYFYLARAPWRQNLLELCSKLLEKENPKLVKLFMSQKLHLRKMGAMSSLLSSNENLVLELQGAVQTYYSSTLKRLIRA